MGLGLRATAKALGISHVALLKALKAGRVKKEPDGAFDVEACRQALAQNSNPGKQKSARAQQRPAGSLPPVPQEAPRPADEMPDALPGAGEEDQQTQQTYNEACRRLEWLKVEKAELELARKRAELVELTAVNAHVAGMIARARDIFLRIDCDERTRREIDRGLRELSEFKG